MRKPYDEYEDLPEEDGTIVLTPQRDLDYKNLQQILRIFDFEAIKPELIEKGPIMTAVMIGARTGKEVPIETNHWELKDGRILSIDGIHYDLYQCKYIKIDLRLYYRMREVTFDLEAMDRVTDIVHGLMLDIRSALAEMPGRVVQYDKQGVTTQDKEEYYPDLMRILENADSLPRHIRKHIAAYGLGYPWIGTWYIDTLED